MNPVVLPRNRRFGTFPFIFHISTALNGKLVIVMGLSFLNLRFIINKLQRWKINT